MKIKDVLAQQNATLENVEVIDKADVRTFQKFGKEGRVCKATLKDDSGEITLTLWNEDIEKVGEGDKISIIDGWVSEWQGNKQISTGRSGKIVKAGEDGAEPESESAPAASKKSKKE
ncbi:MAG: SOSS complex subunit B family protein [archaeon]